MSLCEVFPSQLVTMETEHFTPISLLLLAWNVLYMVELSSLTSLHSEDGSVSVDAKLHV